MVGVAVVTGGNRGLGLETCRQLSAKGLRVVLAARREEEARAAARKLGCDHLQLDVADGESIARAAAELRKRYGGLATLVNNAGVALSGFDAQVARTTLAVNFFGAMEVTDAFRPLLSGEASIVMVSSGMGELSCLARPLRQEFESPELHRDALIGLMNRFIADVAAGSFRSQGWPESAYRVSKVGLNALTRVLARELDGTGIRVNSVCPGWVRTGMGGRGATRSVAEGSRGIVWAALLPAGTPSGNFLRDGAPIPW
ncbi:MAG: SDR family NAD(P)-dependent oxidoreductase [SAR324 cluster bacterium]|nr:SDR family NAD(P)-dependent oxidoreductase [SAR324 cluster bacterium]